MGFLNKLVRLFTSPAPRKFYPITVKCNRCGEIIEGQINTGNDLSIDDDDDASGVGYYCRKVLTGSRRCFQQIEVELRFNSNRKLLDRQIVGGSFVDEQE
ncbi:MAG: hypothetical protein JXB07_06840 [Anaerolineae bacterium]|nr:hypothetical protein [Anaerolineae bacterium]